MLLFPAKKLFHQRYSRQKVVDRVNSGNDSLVTRLLQLAVVWTTCLYYTEITASNELSMSHFKAITWFINSNFFKELHWLLMKQRVVYKILLFGHRLFHHPWKILMYLAALVFRNDKVTRCQYV